MAQIFTAILLTSGIGTALALILTLLKPITRKVFSGGWHYYMWLVVLLVMVLPIRLNLPEQPITTPPVSETVTIPDNQEDSVEFSVITEIHPEPIVQEQPIQVEKVSTIQVVKDFFSGKILLFSLIWLMGTILLFLIKIISYLVFLIKIHKHSEIISCPEIKEYTKRKIRTRVSDTICSPLMIGIFRPTLLLPKTEITPEQLHNVLAHEMTHLKRNDILYKWFVSIVKCVHWFNPAIYLISKQINIDCEISCDLAVVKEMDSQQEKGYVETILTLLTHNNSKGIPLTTGMTGNKKTLKRRFIMIKKRKRIGKATQFISMILAVVIFVSTVFTSGVLANEILNLDDNPLRIEVTNLDEVIEFQNEPLIINDEVYLPLRETLEKIGVMDNENSAIKWYDGKIDIVIEAKMKKYVLPIGEVKEDVNKEPTTIRRVHRYCIEIGSNELIDESTIYINEPKQYVSYKMRSAPVLKNSTTYVPYSFITTMTDAYWHVRYTLYNDANEIVDTSAYFPHTFVANDMSIKIPDYWDGKYDFDISSDTIYAVHKELYNQYNKGAGILFYIRKDNTGVAEGANEKIITERDGYKYIFGYPTDVQYPIWDDRSEKDVKFAEEYQEMNRYVDFIEKSIKVGVINKVAPDDMNRSIVSVFSEEEIKSAKSVVEQYFTAKNERNKVAILSTVTEHLKAPNIVFWQDETITLNNISINLNDQMRKEYVETGRGSVNNVSIENVIVFRVDYTVNIPKGGKSAYEDGKYEDYCMILVRDNKNSQWLIDDMGY